MKDFHDFIDSIDPDSYSTIRFSAKQALLVTGRNENADEAFFIALELLNCYHVWNNEN